MTVTLTYTVAKVLEQAFSKVGVVYDDTEAKNIVDAHNSLNIMLGAWAADPDLAINRMIPLTGYTALSDTVDVPLEYIAAMIPNLAVTLCGDFDQTPSKALQDAALSTLNNIKIYNIRRIGGSIPPNGAINKG